MIQNILRPGASFRKALDYVCRPDKLPELLGGNMPGETPRDLARDFAVLRALNERTRKPVFHASLSASPQDRIDANLWRRIADAYLQRLGYADSLYTLVRHHNTDIDHVHLVASRIDSLGRRIPDHRERERGEAICRQLEAEIGLHRVAPSRDAARAAPRRAEIAAFERSGQVSITAQLQQHLDLAAEGGPTLSLFLDRLSAQGVRVLPNLASTGRLHGLSYVLDGLTLKGSQLGKDYSWGGLQKRHGVSYDPQRDLPRLLAARDAARPPSSTPTPPPGTPPPRTGGPSGPNPPAGRRAGDYRQSAALLVRLSLHQRAHRFADQQRTHAGEQRSARDWFRDRSRRERDIALRERQLLARLACLYRNPEAPERLADAIRRHGHAHAAHLLDTDPASLGPLRGFALGSLRTGERRSALSELHLLARELRELAALQAGLDASTSDGPRMASRLDAAERDAERTADHLRHLPDPERLRRHLAEAARHLGPDHLHRILPSHSLVLLRGLTRAAARALTRDSRDDERHR